jgi:hypothetical protein
LTDGRLLEPETITKGMSSTMTEKTKTLKVLERLRNLGLMLSEDECMGLTSREAEEL